MGSMAMAPASAMMAGLLTPLEAALDANRAALEATVSTTVHLVMVMATVTTGRLAMANARATLGLTWP